MSKDFTILYTIPLKGLKFSTNKIYAGVHWAKRKEIKDNIESHARVFCRPVEKFGQYPIQICYKFFFVSRPLDTLNTSAMAKMFEDALCAFEIIKDDSYQYVAKTILEVVKIEKPKEDYLEIKISPL